MIKALPLTAVIDALRANMLQGAGFAQMASQAAVLGAGWWCASASLFDYFARGKSLFLPNTCRVDRRRLGLRRLDRLLAHLRPDLLLDVATLFLESLRFALFDQIR